MYIKHEKLPSYRNFAFTNGMFSILCVRLRSLTYFQKYFKIIHMCDYLYSWRGTFSFAYFVPQGIRTKQTKQDYHMHFSFFF